MTKIEEYFNSSKISQSFLKNVLSNEKNKTTSQSMRKGSLLDTLTSCPEQFDKNYIIFDISELSKNIKTIFDEMSLRDIQFSDKEAILEIAKQFSFYNGENRAYIELLKHEASYDIILKNKGKEIISNKDYNENKLLAKKLNEWVYFDPEYSQLPVYESLNGFITKDIECKGLLDNLSLDKNTITDLKRTDVPLRDFHFVAKKFGYAFQGAFYTDLVNKIYNINADYQWLVYSSYDNKIAIFKSSPSDLNVGRYGNSYIKGYLEALDIYSYCIENKLPDWDKEYFQNGGIYSLRLYN